MSNPNAAQSDFAVYMIQEEGITKPGFWIYVLQEGHNVLAYPKTDKLNLLTYNLNQPEHQEEMQYIKNKAERLYYV